MDGSLYFDWCPFLSDTDLYGVLEVGSDLVQTFGYSRLVQVLEPGCHPKQAVVSSSKATMLRLHDLPSELAMVANMQLLKMCQEPAIIGVASFLTLRNSHCGR